MVKLDRPRWTLATKGRQLVSCCRGSVPSIGQRTIVHKDGTHIQDRGNKYMLRSIKCPRLGHSAGVSPNPHYAHISRGQTSATFHDSG